MSKADEVQHELPDRATGPRAIVYWTLAAFCFMLAMIGVVLPGIPTTPFLLLMCYFLIRVSPKLHAKAMRWPVVGGPLRDWRDRGGVTLRIKTIAVSMIVLLVGGTLLFSTLVWYVKAVIALAAAYGIVVVLRLKTIKQIS